MSWFKQSRAKNIPICGTIFRENPINCKEIFDDDLMPTISLIERFKKRNNFNFTKIHGEKTSADLPAAESRLSIIYPTQFLK